MKFIIWECKRLFGSHIQIIVHYWRNSAQEFQQPRNLDQELMTDYRGVLLIGLLYMAELTCFLVEPKDASPGISSPTRNWAFPHQYLIKKILCVCLQSELCKHFLSWVALLSENYSLCQIDIKLASLEPQIKKKMKIYIYIWHIYIYILKLKGQVYKELNKEKGREQMSLV